MIYLSVEKCTANRVSQHLSAQALLTSLLHKLGYKDPAIKKDEKGRPYVAGINADISVSHSNDVCVACIATNVATDEDFSFVLPVDGERVGIDIEYIPKSADINRCKRIANRFLNEEVATAEEFYRSWTRKESYGKMIGNGFFSQQDIPCRTYSFTVELEKELYSMSISTK